MSKRNSLLRWGIALVVLGGAAFAAWTLMQPKQTETAPRTVAVSIGDIEETVLASGVIEASTLVSVGAEDILVPPRFTRELAARIPGAELVVIPGGGHVCLWERPEAFNEVCLAFLERHTR